MGIKHTVGDSDLVGLSGALLDSGDVEDTVGIDIEGDLDLRNTTRRRGDTGKLELSEQVVVLRAGTLTLEDLNQHTRLVVGEGREDLGLLGGDSGVALDEGSHDTTGSLNSERQRRNIEEKDLLSLGGSITSKDGGLDGSTVGNSLIGVDGLVGLLAVEEVGHELLDLGDTGRTTNEDDLVDGRLVDLGIAEDTLDGVHGGTEEVLAELLEASTGDRGVEINTLVERVDLDGGLSRRGQCALGPLASSAKTAEGTSVGGEVLLVLALELLDEVVDEAVVEILTTQVSVTSGGLDLEDTLLDGQKRHIESSTTEIEDEHVALTSGLLVKTVGDGSGGGLVDDTKDVETSDHTSILGGLTLRVVEVGRDGNDSVGDGTTEVGLSGLAHLGEDHGGDLLGCEVLGLALELDLDDGLATLVDDLEGEVLHISLDLSVGELASDQSLGVEDGVVAIIMLASIAIDRACGITHGFMATWFLAESPMRRSVSVKATYNQKTLASRIEGSESRLTARR